MLIVAKEPMKCDCCNQMFKPFTIQEAQYHCEKCGKKYTLCKECAIIAKCSCGSTLNDAWTFNGTRIIY